jgi:hypothetical protein
MANIFETLRAEGECSRYNMGVASITGLPEILRSCDHSSS